MIAKEEDPSSETPAVRNHRPENILISAFSFVGTFIGIVSFDKDEFSPFGLGFVFFSGLLFFISFLIIKSDRFRNSAIGQFFWNSALGRWGLVVLSASVSTLIFASFFFGWPVNLRPGCDIAGEITNPAGRDLVEHLVDVQGDASCFEGQSLWLLLRAPNDKFYTTAQVPLHIINDEWSLNGIGVGKEGAKYSNTAYTLYLVAARREDDPIQRKVLDEQAVRPYVSFPALPEGIRVLDNVAVRRKAA